MFADSVVLDLSVERPLFILPHLNLSLHASSFAVYFFKHRILFMANFARVRCKLLNGNMISDLLSAVVFLPVETVAYSGQVV